MDQDTKNILEEIVTEKWEEHKVPILFSQVPQEMKKKGVDLKDTLGSVSLKNAIFFANSKKIKPIQDPDDTKIWALIPSGAETTDRDAFAALRARKKTTAADTTVRFHKAAWAAFAKPLTNDRRFLSVKGQYVKFQDLSADETEPENSYEVEAEHIRKPDEEITDGDIQARIQEWLRAKGMSQDIIVETPSPTARGLDLNNLKSLTEADQARIFIPLDLVLKISSS